MGFNFKKDWYKGGWGLQMAKGLGGRDPGKGQLAQVMALYKQAQMQQQKGYANALYQQRQGLKSIDTGYKAAKGEIARIGGQAKQEALTRETQGLGAAAQSSIDRGLYDTTLYDNMARGVRSDTSRALSNINEALAGLGANLEQSRANAMAGQYGSLSNIFQGQAGAQAALTGQIAQTVAGVQHTDPNAWLQSLFQIGGMALGAGIGGPAGAAIGGQVGSQFGSQYQGSSYF